MNNDDLIILATDLEGDTRVLAEKCRELIADLRIARQDAAQSKIEIKSLQNGGNILRGTIENLEYLYEEAQKEVGRLRKQLGVTTEKELTLDDVKRKYFSNVSWEDLRGRTAKSIFDKIE